MGARQRTAWTRQDLRVIPFWAWAVVALPLLFVLLPLGLWGLRWLARLVGSVYGAYWEFILGESLVPRL